MRGALTLKRLRETLSYDPATGLFTRRLATSNSVKVGEAAGCINGKGYVYIKIDGHKYRANILAWLYMTAKWPMQQIDHKNLVRTDNRWTNLRTATPAQNSANAQLRKDNTSGTKGVRKYRNRWQARIGNGGGHIGTYDTKEEAAAAYRNAAIARYGSFARSL